MSSLQSSHALREEYLNTAMLNPVALAQQELQDLDAFALD
jgi:hypothetical protein